MSDSDTPEVPQEPTDSQLPERPKPQPGGIFKSYNDKMERLGRDEDSTSQSQEITSEEDIPSIENDSMKQAAIKCAEMEEELAEIFNPLEPDEFGYVPTGISDFYIRKSPFIDAQYFDTNVPGYEGQTIGIDFSSDRSEDAKALGIRTNKMLRISLITDENLEDALRESIEKRGHMGGSSTTYYFDENGNYKKVIRLNKNIPLPSNRKLLYPDSDKLVVKIYESEMNARDFEIASGALRMLTDKVRQVAGISETSSESE